MTSVTAIGQLFSSFKTIHTFLCGVRYNNFPSIYRFEMAKNFDSEAKLEEFKPSSSKTFSFFSLVKFTHNRTH